MTVHTFGDSHCNAGWNRISGVQRHHLGPVLCYSIGTKDELLDLGAYGVIDGDVVVFCFGEIDCRCHVQKHISDTRSYENVIDEIVDNYLRAIKRKVAEFADLKVCAYNVPPAIHKETTWQHPQYPYLGTDEERRAYVEYFNACLRRQCPQVGFTFFDIYDQCVDEEGFLCPQISDRVVHITDATIIGGFLNKVLAA
jgi:hypothetical protein